MGIYTQIIDMPHGLNANVTSNPDGSYTILINAKLSAEKQKELYLHEISHIQNYDFEKVDVSYIELLAHAI
jgi:hypothetical protein